MPFNKRLQCFKLLHLIKTILPQIDTFNKPNISLFKVVKQHVYNGFECGSTKQSLEKLSIL